MTHEHRSHATATAAVPPPEFEAGDSKTEVIVTRFSALVLAIVVITLFAVAGIVVVAALGGAYGTESTVTTIIGFCATITASMLAILKGENNAHEIRVTRAVVSQKLDQTNNSVREIERKVNGNLETAIDKAVEAERRQLIDATAMPKTPEELEALTSSIVARVLRDLGSPQPAQAPRAGAGTPAGPAHS